MICSRKAGIEDIPLIRNLAERSFLPTYKEILSSDQLDWMFDWMYSVDSLQVMFSSSLMKEICLAVTSRSSGREMRCFICRKYMFFPIFRGNMWGSISCSWYLIM